MRIGGDEERWVGVREYREIIDSQVVNKAITIMDTNSVKPHPSLHNLKPSHKTGRCVLGGGNWLETSRWCQGHCGRTKPACHTHVIILPRP